ncbi:hypothetical protein EPH_0064340 [Eimeria praecox]|uniref:Uncharacterized protein n=1 Tax=Eimeria praecox TaxID=51316 RepID=U6H5A1_9EIME|nr:hypothetical protein EPH_0064340 [Eimeria praecox]
MVFGDRPKNANGKNPRTAAKAETANFGTKEDALDGRAVAATVVSSVAVPVSVVFVVVVVVTDVVPVVVAVVVAAVVAGIVVPDVDVGVVVVVVVESSGVDDGGSVVDVDVLSDGASFCLAS